MKMVYRLHSSRYPASNGQGAAINSERWNPKGIPLFYAAASPSLAALEILVHYAVLPRGFVLTSISIPESVLIADVPESVFAEGWDEPEPILATQEYGRRWVESKASAILLVPSTIIKGDANYVINVLHRDFSKLSFGQPGPFRFDPRLK